MKTIRVTLENPISDLISDEIFELLYPLGILKDRAIRDYLIRKKFKQLRLQKIDAIEAVFVIQDDYKRLKYDTIRKIVYRDVSNKKHKFV